jgi:hypothetical protein
MVYAVIPTEYTDRLVPVTYRYQPTLSRRPSLGRVFFLEQSNQGSF